MKKSYAEWAGHDIIKTPDSYAHQVYDDWTEERDRLLNEIEELCLHPMTLEARADKAEADKAKLVEALEEYLDTAIHQPFKTYFRCHSCEAVWWDKDKERHNNWCKYIRAGAVLKEVTP